MKCAWGKESGDPNNIQCIAAQALTQGFPFGTASAAAAYGQQIAGYWYPPAHTYPTSAAPAAPAAATSTAIPQFIQGMQGYTAYGQFPGYQQGYLG